MKTLLCILVLIAIAMPATAQHVTDVDFDTTSVRVGDRSAVQIATLELTISVSFEPGDTLHAEPIYAGFGTYSLYAADSTVVVTSRPVDLINHPAIRAADKQRGRLFVDELASLLITLKGLQQE